jgi:hypothetical protein
MLYDSKLDCLSLPFTWTLIKYLQASLVAYSQGTPLWLAPAMPTYIRLWWKWKALANTQVNYNVATITAVKSFTVQALETENEQRNQGTLTEGEGSVQLTVDLFIKVACFVKK